MDDNHIAEEVGSWSETKLKILKDYAQAYSVVLAQSKKGHFEHVYVDAFAGSGIHKSRTTGHIVQGSPLNALDVEPPFSEYHFIDLDCDKVDQLKSLYAQHPKTRSNVHLHEGDCNPILLRNVFPRIQFKDFRRGLCFLDPYGIHLKWEVIRTAGEMKSMEVLINFPIMDINQNVLHRDPSTVDPRQIERLDLFWGDHSWAEIAYSADGNLFGYEEKVSNDRLVEAFEERLKTVGGFKYVPKSVAMRNSMNSIVYYLVFATQNSVGAKIMSDVFKKYRGKR